MSVKAPSELQPMLSILIPAYNYAFGVRRIVVPLLSEGRSDIEILIHDDSSDNGVEVAIRKLAGSHTCLRYVRNSPVLGAVLNWNSLLQSARGRYVILIHHDDFPLSETFASDLLGELERNNWPDALILSCLTYDVARKRVKLCVCNLLRLFIERYLPAYLFRRNVIGPPSVLVVRPDLFEGYDPALKWLVDVEAYFRFLTAQTRRLVFSRLMMVSSTGLPNAISTTIRDSVREIADAELAYLETKYPPRSCWAQLRGTSHWGKSMLMLEWPLWAAVKIVSAICNALLTFASLTTAVAYRDNYFEPIAQNGDTGEKYQFIQGSKVSALAQTETVETQPFDKR